MQRSNAEHREEGRTDRMAGTFRATMVGLALALIAAACMPAALAERFTPAITPTQLPLVNGLTSNGMLLTRTSMPPGLTASDPAYTAPTAAELADEHAAWAWIGPSRFGGERPLAFIVSRVSEIAVGNMNWQYSTPAFFALRHFNGSVQVYVSAASVNVNGAERYHEPYWLNGTYSEITAGDAHMCFLSTDQHVECMASAPGFPVPSALMDSRSAVAYTQISAASRFTCGLRALDQLVECLGVTGDAPSIPMNYTSTLRYVSIAAQFDSGFCGVVVTTGTVACYKINSPGAPVSVVLAAPTLPLAFVYPLWMYSDGVRLPWGQVCAMRNDGTIVCRFYGAEPAVTRPMSQAAIVYPLVVGATSDNGQLQQIPFSGQITSNPTANLFDALRFIGVDLAFGNDATCTAVHTQYPSDLASFIPCATLTHAITLIAHPHTWIQLLPGPHTAASLTLSFGETIIAASPPSCFMPSELASLGNGSWVARMQQTAALGHVVTIDCTGALNCFLSMQSNIHFIGLTFTGSERYAIVSYSDDSGGSLQLPPSTLLLTNCIFDTIGAVLLKTRGSVIIAGCTVSNAGSAMDVTTSGLIDLEDASLTMTGTSFTSNHLPDSDLFLHSCLRSVSSLPVTVSISDSHWRNNSARSTEAKDANIPGGVSLQMQVNGPLVLTVTDSLFVQQDVRCEQCTGGAVSVSTGAGASGNQIQVTFSRVQFDRNLNIMPNVEPGTQEAVGGSNYGSCLAIGDSDSVTDPLLTAADVTITDCSFHNSESAVGGCLALGILNSLTLTESTFENCTGLLGGSVALEWSTVFALGFLLPIEYSLSHLTITRSRVWGTDGGVGGGLCVFSVGILVDINNVTFSETQAIGSINGFAFGGTGGAVQITACTQVELRSSRFIGVSADSGGAISVEASTIVTITDSAFNNVTARSRGGAIIATNCDLRVYTSTFTDVRLAYQTLDVDQSKVIDRVGGAVAVSGGKLQIIRCSFTRVSALPNDLQLSSCAKFYDSGSGFSSIGLGGAISAEYSEVLLSYVTAHDLCACSGGLVFARFSQATVAYGQSYTNVRAHSGGLAVFVSCAPAQLSKTDSAQGISAVAAGGALLFNDCPHVAVSRNWWSDVSVTNGDGGLISIYAQRRPALSFTENVLASVTAPLGAGAVIFVQSAPNAFQPLDSINDSTLNNNFTAQAAVSSLYGPLMATGVAAVSANQQRLMVSAGSLLSTPSIPLRITSLDSYQNIITQDRDLVVQVTCPAVEFRGTTLRRISATDGSALFSDLRIIAVPGNYTLSFSIVTAPAVSIELNLTVTADCPTASFYSSSDRSCVECASDILVYNATANACERCPAGWQRVTANDTSGSLRDGVSCELCPLGQVSTVGSLCAPCGPNTYQPILLSECVQCSSVDGLNCVGDGLAQVEAGFFAMAIGEGTEQRIHTYQCPESFCSAAQVQVATAVTPNSSSLISSSAVNSFSQCAFPRLASPSNLLCGECAEGYRPWGNKCSKCDSVDGGLMVLLVVLSLLLCFWLIRASLGPPSAGHAVVVLYFVQTAMLELGSLNNLLAWLNVVLLSPNSVGRCVAPLTPYQQTQAQILMPVALWIELCIIALVHFLAFKRWGGLFAREPAVDANTPFGSRVRASALLFISQFSVDIYISATLSLLLFTYTQVAVACVSYLRCVEVGSESVVFSQPSMHCGSDEYARTRVLVIFALVAYVAGLPVGIAAFLWRRSDMVRESHSWMVQLVFGTRAWSPSVAAGSGEGDNRARASFAPAVPSSSAGAESASAGVEAFLRRYAPLFAMYSSSAWFWQVLLLCRRTVFVVISVTLLPTPRRRFMAFALSTLASLLCQLYFQPFRINFFNRAELASHVLLIVLAVTLTSEPSPYSAGVDAFIFLLVVPPIALYIVYTAGHTIRQARGDTEQLRVQTLRAQQDKEDELAVSSLDVELQSMQANPAAASDAALQSPSGLASAEELHRAEL